MVAQDLEQHRRKHHVAIFTTFTLFDTNDHPSAVDGGGLQANSFRNAQAYRVASGQNHAMLATSHATEEMHNFFRAQNDGKLLRLLGKRDIFSKGPFFFERNLVKETKRCNSRMD